jgi:rhodanese-related sulfurtransferase
LVHPKPIKIKRLTLNSQKKVMIENLEASAFKNILDTEADVQLIDVRTPAEVEAGFIKGAQFFDIYEAEFPELIMELNPDKKTLIYCRSGARSMSACQYLSGQGFKHLVNLKGGILAWPYKQE